MCDGYSSPVGIDEERNSGIIWPGFWRDATGYLTKYRLGYHTGADLNLDEPKLNSDRGMPVYSIADGEVTSAGYLGDSWGRVIVIKHKPLPDGTPIYSRYGHVENIEVKAGDLVERGQQIATIGLFGSVKVQNYHLHFDISCTDILGTKPGHWPGRKLDEVKTHYVDPKLFLQEHNTI